MTLRLPGKLGIDYPSEDQYNRLKEKNYAKEERRKKLRRKKLKLKRKRRDS